jgi:hypothetical protein
MCRHRRQYITARWSMGLHIGTAITNIAIAKLTLGKLDIGEENSPSSSFFPTL